MRRILILAALVATLFVGVGAGTSQAAEEHPGCKGIANAQSNASTKGKVALATVANKFGCGTATPPPVDPFTCGTGETALATWTYNGVLSDPVSTGWTLLDGDAALAGPATGDHENARGFYWYEQSSDLVKAVVIQSFTGEVVRITDSDPANSTNGGDELPTGHAISQNHLQNRTGVQLVKFCG